MQDHDAVLTLAVRIFLVAFMVGSLLDMGLEPRPRDALTGLGNRPFLLRVPALRFVAGPALAWAISRLSRLAPSCVKGLLFIGLTRCVPLLPAMAPSAKGGTRHAAAVMPVAEGLTIDAWAVAQPILALLLLPLRAGMSILALAPRMAATLGHRVITTKPLFLGLLTVMAYRSGGGLPQRERSTVAAMIFARSTQEGGPRCRSG
jgi:BASS family bile acid:Na+ symporter